MADLREVARSIGVGFFDVVTGTFRDLIDSEQPGDEVQAARLVQTSQAQEAAATSPAPALLPDVPRWVYVAVAGVLVYVLVIRLS